MCEAGAWTRLRGEDSSLGYRRFDYLLDVFTGTLLMLHKSYPPCSPYPPLVCSYPYHTYISARESVTSRSRSIAGILDGDTHRGSTAVARRAGEAGLAGAALGVGLAHGRRGAALAARAAHGRAVDVGVARAEARRRLRVAPVEGVGGRRGGEVVGLEVDAADGVGLVRG